MAMIQEIVGSQLFIPVARKEDLQHKLTVEPHPLELSDMHKCNQILKLALNMHVKL
jgi:hypothetical protein